MSAIERVAEHYAKLTGEGRQHHDVPEWGDEAGPLRIYWQPVTLRDLRRVRKNGEADFAELLVLKAEDAAGQKLFDPMKDAAVLKAKADAMVVTRIGLAMLSSVPSAADTEKN